MRQRIRELKLALPSCMGADRPRLQKQLYGIEQRLRQQLPIERELEAVEQGVVASSQQLTQRRANVPQPEYPEELPISAKRVTIAAAIEAHQVVVIAGETGSGKTTQIPKICLELGRGLSGLIGHTQPRRIAARSVAMRIAEELGSPLGEAVGFKIRFSDQSSPRSYIKLMTDGILLAELQRDRWLYQYDTLIIDEAHERSLNIDFLFGVLKQLLPRRPDLKLIITSATINTERFSAFFNGAPIIEVSGRTYPVEVLYRPSVGGKGESKKEDEPDDGVDILQAVQELGRVDPLGDILIFQAGERDIRDTAEQLRHAGLRNTEVLPLYSRLSASEQDQVFRSHSGRRIVLATNVAETSLTVPGIRFVIDPGLARISRYSHRTKVQRLPIEPISQASANQRKGRCGRVSDGTCIRLYSEEDFLSRDEFPTPEIQRTNLANVILQMISLKLGRVEDFPFIDPPDGRYIQDGYRLLHELGAIDEQRRLTDIGRAIARFPIDPRLARMVLAAEGEGALEDVLTIIAALEIQDPRERPLDKQQQADQSHARFSDKGSDFASLLNLWRYLEQQRRDLSQGQLRTLCKREFISWMRLREWREVRSQLERIAKELRLRFNRQPASADQIHRALLTGLLGQVCHKDEISAKGTETSKGQTSKGPRRSARYLGPRNVHLDIFPGSAVVKKAPPWIMAAEMVESSRLFARTVAQIDPSWIEPLAAHLLKRSYLEPHWAKRPAQVSAWEQVTLNGLIIVGRRPINYGPIDPILSRELFIRHALVEGDYRTHAPFFAHNHALLAEVAELEAKSRRRDLMVDDEIIFQFYDALIPEGIYSGASFDKWRKQAEREQPRVLYLQREQVQQQTPEAHHQLYPDHLHYHGCQLPLSYQFNPGHHADGVAVEIPISILGGLDAGGFEWLVPGLLRDKLVALIRSLPKSLRRNFVPATNFADALLARLKPGDGPLLPAISRELLRMSGVDVPQEQWALEQLPEHLRMTFVVVDPEGEVLEQGRDLQQLKQQYEQTIRATISGHTFSGLEQTGMSSWSCGAIPPQVEMVQQGVRYSAWPALVDEGDTVALRLFESAEIAESHHRQGVLRLFALEQHPLIRKSLKQLVALNPLCLQYAPLGSCQELQQQLVNATLALILHREGMDLPRDGAGFEAFSIQLRRPLVALMGELAEVLLQAMVYYRTLQQELRRAVPAALIQHLADIKQQVERLVYPGFVAQTPARWLPRLPVYLHALQIRLQKVGGQPTLDREMMLQLAGLEQRLEGLSAPIADPRVVELQWLCQELRVSLFAQQLGTVESVSFKRLERRIKAL